MPKVAQVSTNDEFCIENEELCITNEELCIKNEEFCIKMMNFAGRPQPSDLAELPERRLEFCR